MNPTPEQPFAEDDPRLLQAAQEYLVEVESGRRPDRRAFASRFPGLSEALAPYLEALDAVHAARPQLQQSGHRPAPAVAGPDLAEPLGDFRIVKEIGRGGMGVVYEAIQLSLGRKVALKVLPFAAALDARQLQRFKNEAQAAAHLHHTNIVPVHAVGCERGVHFYAMQLIEGENLATIIEASRRASPGWPGVALLRLGAESTGPYCPSAGTAEGAAPDTQPVLGAQLSTQRTERPAEYFHTVVHLVAQAAEGLEYAHGLGIVHRDIKPANILIDSRSNVWITDFGLAQFHAEVGLTQTGDLVGTLRYMSPEQAGGQRGLIDHRTDVYALGATLYELLTLRPLFEATDRQTLLRQIMNDEPRLPHTHNRAISQELETIVLKAVAKSPADRYASARDFADDLERFLRDEPILARRPTLVQRGRRWLRRHPAVPVAGTVLLVLLAVGSLISASFIRDAYQRERQRAEEAEDRFRLARDAADDMIQLAEEELTDAPRKRLLETALVYYQKFIEKRRDDPGAQAELAVTEARVKKILDDLALLQGAGQLTLLREKSVLEDLRPTIDQSERLVELSTRLEKRQKESFRDFFRLSEKERKQRFLEVARSNEGDVAAVLTPKQRVRLRQIDLQLRGPEAFREASIARELKLTAEQKARIETIVVSELFFGMGPGRHGPRKGPPSGPGKEPGGDAEPGLRPGSPPFDGMRKVIEEKRRKASDRIHSELTKEQMQQWQEMTGELFQGPIEGPMRGLFPGPPRQFGVR